jgi:hypothetical protein
VADSTAKLDLTSGEALDFFDIGDDEEDDEADEDDEAGIELAVRFDILQEVVGWM